MSTAESPRPPGRRPRLAARAVAAVRDSVLWQFGVRIELLHRAMGFAALGFVTLVPVLIVVASIDPTYHSGFGQWVVDGLGLSGESADAVRRLFTSPRQVISATTAFSLAVLSIFGPTFGTAIRSVYERVWELPSAPWHSSWRLAVWTSVLVGYLFFEARLATLLSASPLRPFDGIAVTFVSGMLFFWWSQRALLAGRVRWRALLPGAVATMLGLGGLRVFSGLVFAPLIISNAVSYGPIGTVLIVQSWLIGVGFVVYGGALVGRQFWDWYCPRRTPVDDPDAADGREESEAHERASTEQP